MGLNILPNSCRVCLQVEVKMRSLYAVQEEGDDPPNKMLEDLTGISLETIDKQPELPKNICKSCELSLNMAYQFRLKALKTQFKLIDYLQVKVKEELLVEDEDENEEKQEEFVPNIEAPKIKSKPKSKTKSTKYRITRKESKAKQSNANEKKVINEKIEIAAESCLDECLKYRYQVTYVDEHEEEEHLEEEHVEYLDDNTDEIDQEYIESVVIIHNSDNNDDDNHNDDDDDGDCDNSNSDSNLKNNKNTTEAQLMRNNKLTKRIRKPCKNKNSLQIELNTIKIETNDDVRRKKKTNPRDRVHICDICGNIFEQRGRMMEHRRRHIRDQLYTCEICGEGFHLREKLRKHMYLHSGSRPFKCSYCSRSFFYESVKRNHEAVHKGEKPYVCDVCCRAFAYQHTLKKHKLIHEDIKLYHCKYCNKDFRLQHHMKQHEETRTHQNAVKLSNDRIAGDEMYVACEETA